jgi:hypothetical protein
MERRQAEAMKRTAPGLYIPNVLKPAKKVVNIVFWFSRKLDHIRIGAPEWFPIPPNLVLLGYEKIVCRTAHDVERWSQKMRDQERREQERSDEQRDAFEGPILAKMRSDLHHQMANARNQINRDFCRQALAKLDEYQDRRLKEKIESMMHVEGFEDGK